MGKYEQPAYEATPLVEEQKIEIRAYKPTLVAEVEVKGKREEAINDGFRLIADFIFGNNQPKAKIAMTAPVVQQKASEPKSSERKGKKIAMTAPVVQQAITNTLNDENTWRVQFIMPSEYTKETLPKPNNTKVKIKEQPGKTYAVIRFSGFHSDSNIQTHLEILKAELEKQGKKTVGEPVIAFYDPPFTLPFTRRNEVMLELAR